MPVPFVSYIRPAYIFERLSFSYRDGPLEKLWVGGEEFSSHRNSFSLSNSLYEFFFRPIA